MKHDSISQLSIREQFEKTKRTGNDLLEVGVKGDAHG